jgi:hypothetical protein
MIPQSRIHELLLSQVRQSWRKAAMVVGTVLVEHRSELAGLNDEELLKHLQALASSGQIEAQGDLSQMRYSEVRRPNRAGV